MSAPLLRLSLVILLVCGLSLSGQAMAESVRQLGSVGLQVVPTVTGELAVLQVPAGTPAAAAGLKPGDLIVQVDDFPLGGSNSAEVVAQRLWGAEGSQVTIHYLRPGEAGRKAVTLRRAAADPKLTVSPSVRSNQPGKGAPP
jgi:C-terminal processing protease CtpA/Prc